MWLNVASGDQAFVDVKTETVTVTNSQSTRLACESQQFEFNCPLAQGCNRRDSTVMGHLKSFHEK